MKLHQSIFVISVLLLLAYILLLAIYYPSVREVIPIHFSSEGPDGYGSKLFLWLTAGMNALLLLLMGLPVFFPEKMFRKEEGYLEDSFENAVKNRQVVLSVLSVVVTLIFCGLSLPEIIPQALPGRAF
ncbi:DUF1648 domain-containing protein [uncultured Chryseobacterium sp.]|uniref:DUF1648 domain-containing protein n=1 Tax=uncultured Chryseobacterium sp. TaxID=259322 RepID=UPI0025CC96BE|nr:DUF1648 domain-containing protein [uncultured Chryseobacterium sp.]